MFERDWRHGDASIYHQSYYSFYVARSDDDDKSSPSLFLYGRPMSTTPARLVLSVVLHQPPNLARLAFRLRLLCACLVFFWWLRGQLTRASLWWFFCLYYTVKCSGNCRSSEIVGVRLAHYTPALSERRSFYGYRVSSSQSSPPKAVAVPAWIKPGEQHYRFHLRINSCTVNCIFV